MYFCFFLATRSEMLCIDSPALTFFNLLFFYPWETDRLTDSAPDNGRGPGCCYLPAHAQE